MKYKQLNKRLLKYIKSNNILSVIFKDDMMKGAFFTIMEYYIDRNTHHTFARILIDHFLEDYKNGKESESEQVVIDLLYKDIQDFEKEHPTLTLKRLEDSYGDR